MMISVRQLTGAVVVSFCVGAFIAPVRTQAPGGAPPAQASAMAKQPTYMTVEFMKVPEGKQDEWLKLEREWKPMHELRVKDGSIVSWAAIGQAVPGDESNGPVYATKAHPQGDVNALMQQTLAARSMVRTEIWQVLEQTEPAVMGTR
jgi:hypothetical protein